MVTAATAATPERSRVRAAREERARRIARHDTAAWCRLYRPHVRTQTGESSPFAPYDCQADYLRGLDAGGPVIVNKARQIGLSTTTMIAVTRELCERDGWLVLVVSRNQHAATELVRMARSAYATAQMPDKPNLVIDNRQELELSNGARLVAECATQDVGRTWAASRLVFDEFARAPYQEQMWASAAPTIEATGNVVIISTPNGAGDEFERLWSAHAERGTAEEGVGEVSRADTAWRCYRLPWQVHPRRDEAWREAERERLTAAQFAEEYECAFAASGANVFPNAAITEAVARWPQVAARAGASSLRIGGCDVAGEGRDETVCVEIDASAEPYGADRVDAWEHLPGPQLQEHLTARHEEAGVEWAIDYTGVGYGIAQNLSIPHHRVTFTGGSSVTGDGVHQRVPRDLMLSNAVQMLEHGQVALDPAESELLRAIETARWEKRRGEFVDRLDAWLLGLWQTFERTRQRGPTRMIVTGEQVAPRLQSFRLGGAQLP
jgi:hypothetical protein